MSSVNLYYHGGSANHGCEAIVRSTVKILGTRPRLFSSAPGEDFEYEIDKIADVVEDSYSPVKKGTLRYLIAALDHKIYRHDYRFVSYGHESMLKQVGKTDVCLSIGGDNYCYSGTDKLGYYNRMLKAKGCKTVLWGCSVEPEALSETVAADLRNYDLITVRETISYEGLKQAGLGDKLLLCSDPAFQLDCVQQELPSGLLSSNTIGINASPLAVECGSLVMENYVELIQHILEKTEYNVLLIPHVVKTESDDRKVLQTLYNIFSDSGRVFFAHDRNCMELKGLIAQCRIFIGARTHATIAAYSMCVPTLVVGYSVKARGIAKDIFGAEENYVIPVQKMDNSNCLKESFLWIERHEEEIKRHLKNTMPEYTSRAFIAGEAVQRMMHE